MQILLSIGVIVFFVGLVLSHIVVGLTRSAMRSKKPIRKVHRILMWGSVALAILGLLLAGIAYFTMSSPIGA